MPIGAADGTSTRAGGTGLPASARNLDAGLLLIGLGAIVLFVSLFLEWYQPTAEAWDVFEVWDLVLAALAIAALVAVAGRLGFGTPRPASWLIGASIAALVIVLYALIDPPPVADAIGDADGGFGDPGTGLWLALAATVLMAAGTLLSVARISVAFSTAGPGIADRRGRDAGMAADPVVAQPGRAGGPGLGASAGGRFSRTTPSADPQPIDAGAVPPTEPTRRI
ncbi:MAG: hypothetical protein QOC64_2598 [Solirubrobacteraceae bacterium]|jgi:hypothetical protein|nr:hypothetical protein [Solirubrobacteraceae bacterium]